MAIPSGYRKLTNDDIGKTFGIDFEPSIYVKMYSGDPTVYDNYTITVSFSNSTRAFKTNVYGEPEDSGGGFVMGASVELTNPTKFIYNSKDSSEYSYITDTETNNFLSNLNISDFKELHNFEPGLQACSNDLYVKPMPEEQFNEDMTALVDSINTKSNTTTQKTIKEMKTAVDGIPLLKEEEVKDVILDFSTANPQVVNPSTNKVINKVNIAKPSTLLAENIKKDVNIAGVVGTLPNVISVATEADLPTDSPNGTIAIVG